MVYIKKYYKYLIKVIGENLNLLMNIFFVTLYLRSVLKMIKVKNAWTDIKDHYAIFVILDMESKVKMNVSNAIK